MSKSMPSAEVQRMMRNNAITRCATMKINTRKNIMDNREAVGQVMSYCSIIAAYDVLEFDKSTLDRLTVAMNNRADVYMTECAALGQNRARQLLEERTDPVLDKPFCLPAGKYPRKQWEKDALNHRRKAGTLVVRYFVESLGEIGYSREKINETVEEARKNYEQFLKWASEDGEYVAYTRLGRIVEQMTGENVEVVAKPGTENIFGKEF